MEQNIDDLRHIRSMMERSTKFLSLSGMSGVAAGFFALLGAGLAYLVMYKGLIITSYILYDLILIAVLVIIGAALSGLYFCIRKAKKSGSKFWMPATVQIVKDFAIPMVIGGFFCLILIYNNCVFLIGSAMLIFYGISLIYAGSRTYRDIKILGLCEIILGLLAGIFVYNGLLFWAIGFGVLHIIYGIAMYIKYDKKVE